MTVTAAEAKAALEEIGRAKLPAAPDGTAAEAPALAMVTISRLLKDNNRLGDLVDILQARIVMLTNQKVGCCVFGWLSRPRQVECLTRLEEEQHITTQLQQETETIAEYIELYQKQRAAMAAFARDREQCAARAEDCMSGLAGASTR